MQIENLIFSYMAVCVAMILFNLTVIGLNLYRKNEAERIDRNLEAEILAQLERLENGEGLEEGHLKQMRKKLNKVSCLKRFELVIGKLQDQKPFVVHQYLAAIEPCFIELVNHFQNRDTVEFTLLIWIVQRYEIAKYGKEQDREFWISTMNRLLYQPSLYCRENALNILYQIGEPEEIVHALSILDEHQNFHHSKLIHDGLLRFQGDKEELADCILDAFNVFSVSMKVTLLTYLRLAAADRCSQVFAIMTDSKQDDEVFFAAIRYFGRFAYQPAYPVLLTAVETQERGRWQSAAIAAMALRNYPSKQAVGVLKRALCSPNWYIRNNAAQALEFLGVSQADVADVLEGNDRYAKEILQYWLECRTVKEEVVRGV